MIDPTAPSLRQYLPASTLSPAAARSLVVDALAGFPSGIVEVAQLLVSETVTNAVTHSGSAVEVQIQALGPAVCVSVWDDSPLGIPQSEARPADATGGRGLALVDALSLAWGWDCTTDGKRIWFDL
jgi:anti-sigma regulatory factor (Ser/Thr protein kinase)